MQTNLEQLLISQQSSLFLVMVTVIVILSGSVMLLVFRVGAMENRIVKRVNQSIKRGKVGDETKVEGIVEGMWRGFYEEVIKKQGGIGGALKRLLNIDKSKETSKDEEKPQEEDINRVNW